MGRQLGEVKELVAMLEIIGTKEEQGPRNFSSKATSS